MFGSRKVFALNNDMTLNYDKVNDFVKQHKDKSIFSFWVYLYCISAFL